VSKYIGVLAVPALLGGVGMALLAGCGGHPSAPARAEASALATSTAVKADETQAQAILRPCIVTGHVKTAEACLKAAIPPAERDQLGTCLAQAALKGWTSLKTTGAQACLVKIEAVPYIPGVTQPSASAVNG
jgi:hypothetical protein